MLLPLSSFKQRVILDAETPHVDSSETLDDIGYCIPTRIVGRTSLGVSLGVCRPFPCLICILLP
jgi:hypothetical protein